MRQYLLAIGVCVCTLSVAAPPSYAGIIEFLFPTLRRVEPNPEDTGIAPFAGDKDVVDEKGKLKDLPVEAGPLSKPHLSRSEVSSWIMVSAAEALNFDAGRFRTDFQSYQYLFNSTGQTQYLTFLRDNNIQKVVNSGRYHVRSYAEGNPLLLNEGVVHDRYRWLYRVPLIVSFVDKNLREYDGSKVINQRITLTLQLGRVRDASKSSGLQIEQWSGKVEKMGEEAE